MERGSSRPARPAHPAASAADVDVDVSSAPPRASLPPPWQQQQPPPPPPPRGAARGRAPLARIVGLLVALGALAVCARLLPTYEHVAWQLHEHTGACSLAALAARGEEPDVPFARYERAYAEPPPGATASASASAAEPAAWLEQRVDFVWVTATPSLCWASVQSVCATFRGAGTLHVVVPDAMLPAFERDARAGRYDCGAASVTLAVRLHAESALVPGFTSDAAARARFPGTLRQMALKLAAADATRGVVEAAFYVVMDSDVFARRAFGVRDLLVEDEAEVEVGVAAAGANRVQRRTRRVRRQRARTDFDFERGRQPAAWGLEAARALQTRLVRSTDEACAALWPAAEPVFEAGRAAPFALRLTPGGRVAHSACHRGVGMTSHVTPMILSRELVRNVLVARLEALYARSPAAAALAAAAAGIGAGTDAGPGAAAAGTGLAWLDALVAFHDATAQQCASFAASAMRFYSWTEYSLYFVAAAASGAIDDFHAFDFGWLASFRNSVFDARDHRARAAAGWDAVFEDAADPALLVIVQSWMGMPYGGFFSAMRRHLNVSHDEGMGVDNGSGS